MLHCIPPGIMSFASGYVIEGSAVTALGDLIRTPDADGNLRTNVIEIIFKGSTLITGSEIVLFQAYNGSSGSSTAIQSNTSNQIRCDFGVGGSIVSDPVLRDPAAWYHLIFAIDTTQATNTNRGRLFLNGTQLALASATWPDQNSDGQLNDQVQHAFMSIFDGRDAAHFDGYMARAAIYDGLSVGVGGSTDLTPFGEVTDDGFWQINDVSGLTFGNQGVLMEGGAALAAGTDSSGNGNDFTKAGTITATNDGPTNSGDFGNLPTLNPLAPTKGSSVTLSNGNRTVTNTSASNLYNAPFTFGVGGLENTGIYYCEFNIDVAGNDTTYAGMAAASWSGWGGSTDAYLGYGDGGAGTGVGEGVGIWMTGASGSGNFDTWSNGSNGTAGSVTVATNDRLCAALDTATGKCWVGFFDVSGDQQYWLDNDGTERTTDVPASGSNQNHTFTAADGIILFAVACRATHGNNGTLTIKPHPSDWLGTPPSGAKGISTQDRTTPAVVNYQDEYYILAGIGHTTGTTTDVHLPKTVSGGAMVRIKRTNTTGDWIIFDTSRGVNKALVYNEDDVQDTSTYDDQNFDGTTFTMPSDLPSGTYVLECFYVGSFFQMTAYTGNDTARAISFAAALDTAPGMMYIKNLDTASRNGIIYHQSTGNTHYLRANLTTVATDSATRFNDTSPTTAQFTVGTENVVNQDGKLMICYAWANSGPYAFGSYTGNGNVDGPVVNVGVGGRPQFLFRRNSGAATFYSTTSPQLNSNEVNSALNLSSTQALTADAVSQMDFLSTGFKTRDNGSEVHLNSSGATYIYGAFGIQPLTDGSINQGRAK